jgi:flagellar hook-length control protein FliK
MNATPAVSQTQAADPAQTIGAAAADSTRSSGSSQDFAAALRDAGPKPARKHAPGKGHDAGSLGGALPAPGNPSPPATSRPAAGGATSPAAESPGVAVEPGVVVVASERPAGADSNPPGAPAASTVSVAPIAPAASPPLAAGGSEALVTGALGIPESSAADAPIAPAAAAGSVPAPAATASSGKPSLDAASGPGDGAVADLAAPATGPGSAADAGPNAATGAPAAMAAAVSATAHATACASSDADFAGGADSSASPADELAMPATGTVAGNAGGLDGAPSLSLAATGIQAAAAAMVTGAVNTHAGAALTAASASQSASDKGSRAGNGDPPLAGSSPDGVAGAAQLTATANADAAGAASAPSLNVNARVDAPEFGQGIADRVSWMIDNNLSGAKLQVNPPQLGPIEVRIAILGDHAQVWLTSHSAVARDALEASSPRLRDMLGAQGFGQVSVDISQRSFQERSAYPQPRDFTPGSDRSAPIARSTAAAPTPPRASSGAVDAYA